MVFFGTGRVLGMYNFSWPSFLDELTKLKQEKNLPNNEIVKKRLNGIENIKSMTQSVTYSRSSNKFLKTHSMNQTLFLPSRSDSQILVLLKKTKTKFLEISPRPWHYHSSLRIG